MLMPINTAPPTRKTINKKVMGAIQTPAIRITGLINNLNPLGTRNLHGLNPFCQWSGTTAMPGAPLLAPIQLRHYPAQLPLSNRIVSCRHWLHEQYLLLNIRRQQQQVHDLRKPCPTNVPQPGQIRVIPHVAVSDQFLEPVCQRQQSSHTGHTATWGQRDCGFAEFQHLPPLATAVEPDLRPKLDRRRHATFSFVTANS